MSATQSNLSSSQYGYDFVVATTQASINATMDEFISGLQNPVVTMCYVMDDQGNPQPIDYEQLKTNANGTDPFSVPNGSDPHQNQDVINLSNASFMYAFRAQLGIPRGYAPLTPGGTPLPNIVTLGSNTASVTYNLMCSEFNVVEATYGPKGITSWLNQSQPDGDAWIFTSQVDLRMEPGSDYSKLPTAVQNELTKLGGNAFSVQQLLFDLDNSALESVPVISNIAAGTPLYNCLQTEFVGAYFTTLQSGKGGQPVLNYSIVQSTAPPSSLTLTDLNMEVNAYVGSNGQVIANPSARQQDLATLCYLCAADGNLLPAATPFTWNWIDSTEATDYEGVIAINRNTFINSIKDMIVASASRACFLSNVDVYMGGTLDTKTIYHCSLTSGQTPSVGYPATGSTVMTLSYSSSASDDAGLGGDMGALTLAPTYSASVNFSGNTIVISQNLTIYVDVRSLQNSESWNAVNKTVTDTYTISVNQNGGLTATLVSNTVDNSQSPPGTDWFTNLFTDLSDITDNIESWLDGVGSINLDIPVGTFQSFIFPGGKTFTYCDAEFSDNQDLISHITYTEPSN